MTVEVVGLQPKDDSEDSETRVNYRYATLLTPRHAGGFLIRYRRGYLCVDEE